MLKSLSDIVVKTLVLNIFISLIIFVYCASLNFYIVMVVFVMMVVMVLFIILFNFDIV